MRKFKLLQSRIPVSGPITNKGPFEFDKSLQQRNIVWTAEVQFSAKARNFSLIDSYQNSYVAQSDSYPKGTGLFFSKAKMKTV
jgi:hypothetical protein